MTFVLILLFTHIHFYAGTSHICSSDAVICVARAWREVQSVYCTVLCIIVQRYYLAQLISNGSKLRLYQERRHIPCKKERYHISREGLWYCIVGDVSMVLTVINRFFACHLLLWHENLCGIFFERFGQCSRVSTSKIHWFRPTYTLPEIFRLSHIIVLKQWKWLRWLFNSILIFIVIRNVSVADCTRKGNGSVKDTVTSNSLQMLVKERTKSRFFLFR